MVFELHGSYKSRKMTEIAMFCQTFGKAPNRNIKSNKPKDFFISSWLFYVLCLFHVHKNIYNRPVSAQEEKKIVTYFQQAALFSCTPGMRIQAGIKFVCFSPSFLSVSRSLLCPLSVHTHMTHVYLPRFWAAELQCWTTKPKCCCTDVASEHTKETSELNWAG